MSDIDLHRMVTDIVDARLGDLELISALLQAKFPEHFAIGQGGVDPQPCNTEFTTVGRGTAGVGNAGFMQADRQARMLAQTICNTGNCKKLVFLRYVEARISDNNQYVLTLAWKCTDAGAV